MRSNKLIKAILWLHLKRLGRYKYSFINYILIDIMWYLIFLLGALMFVPSEEYSITTVITFWGIVLWAIMNNSVWLIAGWTWFILSMGLVEEHYIRNVNPLAFVAGRFITGISISLATIPLILIIFTGIADISLLIVHNIALLLLGILLIIGYATLYALTLAALSFRIQVPGTMLDILNIFMYIGGGLGVPISKMPEQLRYVALAMPYTHAAEIVRYGALGIEPYLGLVNEIFIAIIYLLGIALVTYIVVRRVMNYIRIYGVRAVGRM
ncbi:MAG: hypothetical protein DRO40_00560 [Thermoprotei archaeon]|nr:MAG: hypothetical protein DRO40_00560 [Thermoprotei archaeon]